MVRRAVDSIIIVITRNIAAKIVRLLPTQEVEAKAAVAVHAIERVEAKVAVVNIERRPNMTGKIWITKYLPLRAITSAVVEPAPSVASRRRKAATRVNRRERLLSNIFSLHRRTRRCLIARR